MCPAAQASAPHSGRASSKRQSTIAQSGSARCALRAAGSISVVGMAGRSLCVAPGVQFRRCALGDTRGAPPPGGRDGHRGFLGQRQSRRVARVAGARVQASALREPPAAVLQTGAQVSADAGAQSPRPRAGAQGRGLRVLRVARDPVLPGPEVPAAADLRPQARGSGHHHARHLRIPGVHRAAAHRHRLRGISGQRSKEHTSELQSPCNLVCRLLLEKKNNTSYRSILYFTLEYKKNNLGCMLRVTILSNPVLYTPFRILEHYFYDMNYFSSCLFFLTI